MISQSLEVIEDLQEYPVNSNQSISCLSVEESIANPKVFGIKRVNILGVEVSAINLEQALKVIEYWVSHRTYQYICVTAAHCIMDSLNSLDLRNIYNASGLTTPDGMSLVWLMRMRGYRHVGRVYGADLMLEVCKRFREKGYRHFFYGGAPGVAENLASRLQLRFPGIQIAGTYSPPFKDLSPDEDRAIVELINRAQPDIVWIGLSSPKQDLWMATHVGRLTAPILIGVGAAFDFLSGNKRQAPYWMQRLGIEWLFRLAMEPRRLWRRYIQYPKFAYLALAQIMGFI